MHVLVTADTMSGAWTYTRELVTGLVTRGVRVTLVTFGEIPLPDQTTWMDLLHGLEYRPTAFRLEWMDEAPHDLPESSEFLVNLVREVRPDLLHLHQFCHATLPVDVPRVVMAHGDVITWTQAVQGCAPRPTRWLQWYRDTIVRGITSADAVVAPSAWMLQTLRATYTRPRRETVIYPGRNPIFFNPYVSKDDSVLSVGRLLDAGKQVLLLTQHAQPFSVCIVGAEQAVPLPRIPIRADVKVSTDQSCVAIPAAPSSPMTSPASAKSGATPPFTSAPTTPTVSPRPFANSMPIAPCVTPMPIAPIPEPANASPPNA